MSENSENLISLVGQKFIVVSNDINQAEARIVERATDTTLEIVKKNSENFSKLFGQKLIDISNEINQAEARIFERVTDMTLEIVKKNSENFSKLVGQKLIDISNEINQAEVRVVERATGMALDVIAKNFSNFSHVLNDHTSALSTHILRSAQEQQEAMLLQRALIPVDFGFPQSITLVSPPTLEQAFKLLQDLAPINYSAYRECLDEGTRSYEGLPKESCSTQKHPQSNLFRHFLRPYLRGMVLDVGCGPQPVPGYLEQFPIQQIVGIDPISSESDHAFVFVSGVGEFLPFNDNQFGTVISGTTLDHYYLLDRGLKEAFRVLEPGGHFVAWITEFEGAPIYNPYEAEIKPFDSEHMYHIDREWFLPLMEKIGFEISEILHFRLPFNYLFMSFRKPG
jgi:SAM-dependent methyltransferase/phenylpyruvate tautomerase PptA (4-oxalocrotonate tautomerase family)